MQKISKSFHVMAKPTGPICNMDCTYCFYLEKEKLFPGRQNWAMSDDVLKAYIRGYIRDQDLNQIVFAWQGGEPTLLGVEFFRNVIKLQQEYSLGKEIQNTFQTNGILLDDEWGDFFAENKFLIGLSIDGPDFLHDKYRVLKGNQPTFEKVMRGVSILKKHEVDFNTLTVVNKANSYYPVEVYNFLKEIGSHYMQFIPIVERTAENAADDELKLVSPDYDGSAKVTEWSVESLKYGEFLFEIFTEWLKKDVGKYFVQIFDVSLESWVGMQQSLCVFNETCGKAMALESNGDLFSCDHYVYPENRLGNLLEKGFKSLVDSGKQQKFGLDKKFSLPKYCQNCSVRFACNGECPKHRFIKTPDGEDGLNYLCSGYKYFFNKIDPYMSFMADELAAQRPPANVMKWALRKERGFTETNIGRNQPCPCGSGKKYKKCCGAGKI